MFVISTNDEYAISLLKLNFKWNYLIQKIKIKIKISRKSLLILTFKPLKKKTLVIDIHTNKIFYINKKFV
jgi:hypothetical protein